jgi:ribosomal protein S15
MTLPFRLFSSSTTLQASTSKRNRKFRDPYAVTQARARKAANVSRQEVLAKERAEALGDPIRGQTTPFVESFDVGRDPQDTSTLNHFLHPDEIDAQLKTSKELLKPLTPQFTHLAVNQETEDQQARLGDEIRTQHEKNHENVQAALQRIINLDNGSSKDRLRSNIQRCIQHFGRHETDHVLPPKPKATAVLSIEALKDQKAATVGVSDRAERPEINRVGPDTGSSEVQIAILTAKIRSLANHLDSRGRKDKVGKRDLRLLVHRRQKLLQYLRRKERGGPRWQRCIETLGLTEGTWQGEISL